MSDRIEQPILSQLGGARKRRDRFARGLIALNTAIAIVPLVLILYFLIKKGVGAFSLHFFTTDPSGSFLGDPGGIRSAIVGTIEIVGLATLFAVPVGLAIALYLSEYGSRGRFAGAVRFIMDVMTGVPSIMFGLFIYITLVITGVGGSGFAGWKGALALAFLMLPIVTRSAEVALELVPDAYDEAGYALGAERWQVILRVVLPSALPGVLTGSLLAVARAIGETAPLLFTAAIVNGATLDLNSPMNSLPAQIFNDVGQPRDAIVQRAWGAALTLVLMILVLNLAARALARRNAGARSR